MKHLFIIILSFNLHIIYGFEVDCTQLRLGQYLCPDPAYDQIDPVTQQYYGCTKENKAKGRSFLLFK